ncbi:hypothetical protein GCM10009765_43720 [Fodinicola feengrottensis]|uniref:Uncharacterized protein n=1 Tax=Fodinicola feengrottensis TaxID=435914 RepID=A0ABN2HL50_9ACTN
MTTLPALEAVQACKAQGWTASEQLDRALRIAFWSDHRCISLRHVILDIAAETDGVDEIKLQQALDHGTFRSSVIDQFDQAGGGRVNCSPHVFLADGTNVPNPGVRVSWLNGGFGSGFPAINDDDPAAITRLLKRAAELVGR